MANKQGLGIFFIITGVLVGLLVSVLFGVALIVLGLFLYLT